MSLLLHMLSWFVIAFLPRIKYLLISWLHSLSAVIMQSKKIKSVTISCFLIPGKSLFTPPIPPPPSSFHYLRAGLPCRADLYHSIIIVAVLFVRSGKAGSVPFNSKSLALSTGEGNGTPIQYSCLESPMDGGAWWAAVYGVAKSRTRLRDFTFTFHFHALEKEMATHSSVLAWRIPGMGEPGRRPSLGSHRVGHD